MERRRFLRALAGVVGVAGIGGAGCIESDSSGDTNGHDGTPTPIYVEVTPEATPTPEGSPIREETPDPDEPTPSPRDPSDPGEALVLESDSWESEEDGQRYLFVDGNVHNAGIRPVEVRVHAAGWYENQACTDGDSDVPDWEVGPTWQILVGSGVTWEPLYPWRRPYERFDSCGYERPRVWIAASEYW